MADIASLVRQLMDDGSVRAVALNTGAQFGIAPRAYLGATLLPERLVDENAYREDAIRYRTVIANSGTRYSPSQKKGAEIIGSMLVELANSDLAREFTSRDYDALVRLLQTNPTMEGAAQLIRFLDTVNLGLAELNEKMRWEAIVGASLALTGDNGYAETVSGYSNPSGHRAAAGDSWSDDTYDPFDDILSMADLLESKGYTVGRIITSRPVLSILSANAKVKTRTGVATINTSGQITATAGRATRDAINGALGRDDLPPIETYDLQYRTQTGSGYFLDRDVFVMVATTGRDETIDLADSEQLTMNDTLGYLAVGRAAGQSAPGRVLRMEAFESKPPRVEAEGWQTSLPVITEPEAIAVITDID